jgi:hypothetical protein
MHTAHADFHVKAAKAHAKLSKCFAKSEVEGAADLADAHDELAKAHVQAASDAVQCAKALDASSKAAGMGDDDLVPMPAGLSSVYKVDAQVGRAVPRTGAPGLVDVSGVDGALRKFIEVEDSPD